MTNKINNDETTKDLDSVKVEQEAGSEQYITIDDIQEHGKFFALKTPMKALKQAYRYNQYKMDPEKFLSEDPWWNKNGKVPKFPGGLKSPEIDRSHNPKNYTGLNDKTWGTALLCNEIPELEGYLTVIDLDNKEEVSIGKLKEVFSFIMNKTRVHKTGSGGYHIYLFSREKPTLSQPPINIDYQKNGNIVVFDYRYELFSDKKPIDMVNFLEEHYMELSDPDQEKSIGEFIKSYKLAEEKLEYKPINDMDILVVPNSDDILEEGLNKLGLKSNKKLAVEADVHHIDFDDGDYTFELKILIEALTPFFTKGRYYDLGLYLAGFLSRNYYSEELTKELLDSFNEDGKGDEAIRSILDGIYYPGINARIPGWTSLSDYIKGYNLEEEKKTYLLDMLYTQFKRDITSPGNTYKYKDEEGSNVLYYLIKALSECFSPESTEFESEKLLYYLYKKGIIYSQIKTIFKSLFGAEYWTRLKNAKSIFNERKSRIHINKVLAHMIGRGKMEEIESIRPSKIDYMLDEIKDESYYFRLIQELNDNDEKIKHEIFHNYIDCAYQLKVNETGTTVYKPTNKGYMPITPAEFSKSLVDEFRGIAIPRNTIEKTFQNMNQILPVKHNVLHFKNGMLEIPEKGTKPVFKENEYLKNALPKNSFPFNWNPKATGGKLREILEEALTIDDEGFEDNLKVFLKSLGHSCMGKIEQHIITILVGPPGSSKSTILMMLKRGLSFSEVPISDIVENERFALGPVVNQMINIDDDLQSNMWKGIGKMNTFVSGGGGIVEIKFSNIRIILTSENTPKLWGASNNLPPVIGDGFERRLILIKVPKKINPKDMDNHLQSDILEGKYDEDLEWLYYTAITTYLEERNMPFVSQEQREIMNKEYKTKSDSLFNCVEELFEFAKDEYVEVGEAKELVLKWHDEKEKEGIIFKEQKGTVSSQKIKNSLERLGGEKIRKSIPVGEGNGNLVSEQRYVYMDIRKKKRK